MKFKLLRIKNRISSVISIAYNNGIARMFIANVLNNVIGMLSSMIITRLLTKQEYGIWSFTLNIYSYLSLISAFGLLSGAFQFGTENVDNEKKDRFFKYCLTRGVIINGVLSLGFIFFTIFINFSIQGATPYIRMYIPIIVLDYLLRLILTLLRCEDRIRDYALLLNVNTFLNAAGTCIGALAGVGGAIVGRYIAIIISLIQIAFKTKNNIRSIIFAGRLQKNNIKQLWHYSCFTGLSSALNSVVYLVDVTMVAELLGSAELVATYKVATMLPMALSIIPNSVIIAILPKIIKNRDDKDWLSRNIRKLYLYLGALNLSICLFVIIFAPLIITILSGKQYLSAVSSLQVLTFGYFISGTFRSLSVNILAAFKHVYYGLFISITSLVADCVFNYMFIKQFGMIGAAYATLGVDIVTGFISFALILKVFCTMFKDK